MYRWPITKTATYGYDTILTLAMYSRALLQGIQIGFTDLRNYDVVSVPGDDRFFRFPNVLSLSLSHQIASLTSEKISVCAIFWGNVIHELEWHRYALRFSHKGRSRWVRSLHRFQSMLLYNPIYSSITETGVWYGAFPFFRSSLLILDWEQASMSRQCFQKYHSHLPNFKSVASSNTERPSTNLNFLLILKRPRWKIVSNRLFISKYANCAWSLHSVYYNGFKLEWLVLWNPQNHFKYIADQAGCHFRAQKLANTAVWCLRCTWECRNYASRCVPLKNIGLGLPGYWN